MQSVNRYEHDVSVLIGEFHYLLIATHIVLDSHQSPEHAYTVVDMHYVVTYIERRQIVYSQLLGLFYRLS